MSNISKEDYKQVFEETIMSVLDGLTQQGIKAEIPETIDIVTTWVRYYWRKNGGDSIRSANV